MKIETLKKLPKNEQPKLVREPEPQWTEPMLAYLEHHYFWDKGWFYERKFDGERCLAFIKNGTVRLRSRNNKTLNISYPEIAEALKKTVKHSCILDGEVCAFKGENTSFEKLQARMHVATLEEALATQVPVDYYIFDILYLDNYDITRLPLRERKKILKAVVPFKGHIRYSAHRIKGGQQYYKAACRKKWEGLMCKDPDAPYVHVRSTSWLKFKCVADQELVIGGYTDPQHSRIGFGALLLGYYEDGKFHYAGKVGTGFNDQLLKSLSKELKKIEIKKSPFIAHEKIKERGTHWIKPKLVAEIGFTEWTKDNKLRHPRFKGLRYDKAARDVRQEKISEQVPQKKRKN